MADAILRVVSTSYSGRLVWHRVDLYLTALFDQLSSPPLNRVVAFISPYVPWDEKFHNEHTVARWAAAVLAVPYTEEIGSPAVDALLQIASIDSLRPHIPIDLWAWLKKLPSLPVYRSFVAGKAAVVRHVRQLGDIEILKSYFLLIWSEWNFRSPFGLEEMQMSIREDFGGIELKHHREDIMERLDYVLGQLERGTGYINEVRPAINVYDVHRAKTDYRTLKETLLEVDRRFPRSVH